MILLDTCVISEVLRPEPSPEVLSWLDGLPEQQVYVPSIVIGELQKGVDLLPEGIKRSALRVWLEQLRERFRGRILDFDELTAVTWGQLSARLERAGRGIPLTDGMIASVAIQHSALLATRNVKDYEGSGAEIVNPWESGK